MLRNTLLIPLVTSLVLAVVSCTSSRPEVKPSGSLSCEGLPGGDHDPGLVDPAETCARYRDEFLPAVGESALACIQAAEWSVCDNSRCTLAALRTMPAEADPRCDNVEKQCPGMGASCREVVGGMNDAGRDRFTRCLSENCGLGLRYCLWDPKASPCRDELPQP